MPCHTFTKLTASSFSRTSRVSSEVLVGRHSLRRNVSRVPGSTEVSYSSILNGSTSLTPFRYSGVSSLYFYRYLVIPEISLCSSRKVYQIPALEGERGSFRCLLLVFYRHHNTLTYFVPPELRSLFLMLSVIFKRSLPMREQVPPEHFISCFVVIHSFRIFYKDQEPDH